MNDSEQLNELLVYLFDHTLELERRYLITDKFKDISVNDMHIISAIGLNTAMNMTALARKVGVTVGTLTIAINGLVRKEYAARVRSSEDRRVVLVSLTEKGEEAYRHHMGFHRMVVNAVQSDLDEGECEILIRALSSLERTLNQL